MIKVSNNTGIPLGLAVWVLYDEYDYNNAENYISATALMKPLRQIVLAKRVPPEQIQPDVSDFVASCLGKAIHDSVEKAWVNGYRTSLKQLGYPDSLIDRVKINPTNDELTDDTIPIYLEQRAMREIPVDGVVHILGGKFDMIAEGLLQDNKSTSAYTWVYGGKDDDYTLQGSIYRWLNQDKVKEDFIRINFIFTDWQKASAAQNPAYPQKRLESKDYPLMSIQETETWITNKIALVAKYKHAPEHEIPECTADELWMGETTYRYYADPAKVTGKSTKNFTNQAEASAFHAAKGGKGIVITAIGKPKRCEYCNAFPVCTQKDKYFPAE